MEEKQQEIREKRELSLKMQAERKQLIENKNQYMMSIRMQTIEEKIRHKDESMQKV